MEGYKPTFTGKASDLGDVARNTSVTVTSDHHGITAKAFTVQGNEGKIAGETRLILEEA